MDKKIANNLVVGVFVLIGAIGFLFVLFNIGEGGGIFSHEIIVFGKFKNVKGLNYGSEVSLAGLRVGTVKKISLSQDDPNVLVVNMGIQRDLIDRVRKDTIASIKTSGVLGDRYVDLTIGSMQEPAVQAGDYIITQEPEDLFTKSGSLVENINGEFKKGGDLNETIRNLDRVSQNLAFLTTEMREQKGLLHELIYGTSGAKLNQTVSNLAEITNKIKTGQGSLGALINDPSVYEDLKSMMGGAKRSTILRYYMQKFIQSGNEAKEQKQ